MLLNVSSACKASCADPIPSVCASEQAISVDEDDPAQHVAAIHLSFPLALREKRFKTYHLLVCQPIQALPLNLKQISYIKSMGLDIGEFIRKGSRSLLLVNIEYDLILY